MRVIKAVPTLHGLFSDHWTSGAFPKLGTSTAQHAELHEKASPPQQLDADPR